VSEFISIYGVIWVFVVAWGVLFFYLALSAVGWASRGRVGFRALIIALALITVAMAILTIIDRHT